MPFHPKAFAWYHAEIRRGGVKLGNHDALINSSTNNSSWACKACRCVTNLIQPHRSLPAMVLGYSEIPLQKQMLCPTDATSIIPSNDRSCIRLAYPISVNCFKLLVKVARDTGCDM